MLLAATICAAGRWGSLHIVYATPRGILSGESLGDVLRCYTRGRQFPNLMDLTGICKRSAATISQNTYRCIKAPKLRHFSITDDFPNPTHCPTSISSFSITLTADFSRGARIPLTQLTSYLAAASSLTELSLNFVSCSICDEHSEFVDRMEKLEKLHLVVTETPRRDVGWVHKSFGFPRLRTLEVELRLSEHILSETLFSHNNYSEVSDYLCDLMPAPEACKVANVRLSVIVTLNKKLPTLETLLDLPGLHLLLPLYKLPHLEQLVVETNILLSPELEFPSSLKEITFRNSPYVEIDYFWTLRAQMESLGTWDDLRMITIEGCNQLQAAEPDLRALIPQEKLRIYPS